MGERLGSNRLFENTTEFLPFRLSPYSPREKDQINRAHLIAGCWDALDHFGFKLMPLDEFTTVQPSRRLPSEHRSA